jgi:hypothetical protein
VTLTLPGSITRAYDIHTGADLPISTHGTAQALMIPYVRFGVIVALDAAQR